MQNSKVDNGHNISYDRPVLVASGTALAIQYPDPFLLWDQELLTDFIASIEKSLKRTLDIIGALVGLTSLAPVLLLTAIMVKATSRGPIFFSSKTVWV